jgi:hypothetical protein
MNAIRRGKSASVKNPSKKTGLEVILKNQDYEEDYSYDFEKSTS